MSEGKRVRKFMGKRVKVKKGEKVCECERESVRAWGARGRASVRE